jgi:hypothetical protein
VRNTLTAANETVPKIPIPREPAVVAQELVFRGTDSNDGLQVSRIQALEAPGENLLQPQQPSPGKEGREGNASNSGMPQTGLTPLSGTVPEAADSRAAAAVPREMVARGAGSHDHPQYSQTQLTPNEASLPKQDALNRRSNSLLAADNHTPAEDVPVDKGSVQAGGSGTVRSPGDLQSMEDIYRAAGIMNPPMGYSVSKVVEMINSDHMRGLPSDAKRAGVLMALDAASISVGEVLRDAALRQDALRAYEAEQRKSFEECWARKIEANAQIQAEIDRVMAQNLERIKRNLDEVAFERAEFARWQTTKHQEAERISEAVGLCSKPSASDAPSLVDTGA